MDDTTKNNQGNAKIDLPKSEELGEVGLPAGGEFVPQEKVSPGLSEPPSQSPLESAAAREGGEAPVPAETPPETGGAPEGAAPAQAPVGGEAPPESAPTEKGAPPSVRPQLAPTQKAAGQPQGAEKQPQEEEQPQQQEEERQDQDQEREKERKKEDKDKEKEKEEKDKEKKEKEEKEKEGEEKEKGKEGKEEPKEGEEKPTEEETPKEEGQPKEAAEEAPAEGEAAEPGAEAGAEAPEAAAEAPAEAAPEAAEGLAPEAAGAAAEVPAEAVAPGAAGAAAEAAGAGAAEVTGAGAAEVAGAAGAEAGVLATGAATAPETMGIGAAVAAGAAGAMEAAKAAEKTAEQIKKASGGLVDIDPTQKIRRKTIKWGLILAIALPILFVALLVILIVYFIFPRFHTDTTTQQNQAVITEVTNLASSNKITFESADDLNQIKNGDIGLTSLQMMKYLANKHDGLTIHYSGVRAVSDPNKKENDPSEFDVTAVDKIKCTDTATKNKAVDFPISLNPKFDWQSRIPTGSIDQVVCAVSYYPTLESPVKGPYADKFGPGEFKLAQLATSAPMASQEKTAELLDEVISENKNQGIDPNSENSLLPQKIEIPKVYVDQNLAHGGAGVLEELKSTINEVYQNKNEYEGVTASDDSIGLHVSFL